MLSQNMRIFLLICISMLLVSCSKSGNNSEDPVPDPPPPVYKADNNVVAHRGAWKEFGLPDNSVAALKKAMEFNSYASECDIMMTKDKVVVVYHDETIGGKYFKDVNFSEIENHLLSNGEKLPTLSVFLDEVVKNKNIQFWIDIKSLSDAAGGNAWAVETAKRAAELIREKKAQKQTSFIVGRKAVLDQAIFASRGEWPSGYMNTDYSPAQFETNGYNWANFSYTKFYESGSGNIPLIKSYTDKNIKVSVYTVDNNEAMEFFISQPDVFAITTNEPFKLVQKIRNRN